MEYQKKKIGEITESCLGKMLDAEKNKGIYQPYLANINVRWGEFDLDNLSLMRFEEHEEERYGIKEGDLIMCEGGEPGRCAVWHEDVPNMKIQKALHRIRAKDELNIEYLYYWFLLMGRQGALKGFQTETTIKHLPGDKLREIEIALPDRKTQDSVVAVLAAIDKKIKNNKKINDNLYAQAQLLFEQWFVRYDFLDIDGQPYKSSGGKMRLSSELGVDIPYDWEVKSLKNLYVIKRGISYTSADLVPNGGTPMINLACIDVKRNYKDGELKYIKSVISDEKYIENNALLIACTDLTRNAEIVGSPVLVPDDGNRYTYSMDLAEFIPDERCFNKYFIYMALRQDYYHNFIKKFASGTNVLHLNLSGLDWYSLAIPPMDLQDMYGRYFEEIQKEKNRIMVENRKLAALREWLLPMLMNGQATIPD